MTRIGSVSCSVSTSSRSPSSSAAWAGWMLSVTTRRVGQRAQQPRQVLADPRLGLGRPQHPAHHQLAGRRLGDEDVLELAAPRRHVVRRQRGAGHERGEDRQRGNDPGRVERAVAQVDRAPPRVPQPEGRLRRRSRRRPSSPWSGTPRERSRPAAATPAPARSPSAARTSSRVVACLAASCSSYGTLQPGARPALEPVVVPALQEHAGHAPIVGANGSALGCGRGHHAGAARGGAGAASRSRQLRDADRRAVPRARALRGRPAT